MTPPVSRSRPGSRHRWHAAATIAVAVTTAIAAAASMSCRDRTPSQSAQATPDSDPTATGATATSGRVGPAGESAHAATAPPGAPLRADPVVLDLGSAPIRNPLNLYDIGLAGGPDHETVGTIDGVRITTTDLEAHSVGAFSRIAEAIYAARDDGYRWLIEHTALTAEAEAAHQALIPFLLAQYRKLPAPTEAELERVLAGVQLVALPDDERRHAAVSLWRLAAWEARRAELVLAGREGLPFSRRRQRITAPAYARPDAVVAILGERQITRAQERALAGYHAALARHEYWRIAQLQFERYATTYLLEREAQHLGVSVDELQRRERDSAPAITDDAIRAFIADNPEYGRDPDGYQRAADNVRRLRAAELERALTDRLRATAEIRFVLEEPAFEPIPVDVPGPRWHGAADAPHTLVAYHGLGCNTCARGSRLLLSVMRQYPGPLKVVAGDYFEPGQLGSYRGAVALHCAPPERRDALLAALVADFGAGLIGGLTDQAHAVGVDKARFRVCLVADRPLPVIVENLALARRLGLERNIPGLFANGQRIGDLKDVDAVVRQIQSVFAPESPRR